MCFVGGAVALRMRACVGSHVRSYFVSCLQELDMCAVRDTTLLFAVKLCKRGFLPHQSTSARMQSKHTAAHMCLAPGWL